MMQFEEMSQLCTALERYVTEKRITFEGRDSRGEE
jgi:hypothetical protein